MNIWTLGQIKGIVLSHRRSILSNGSKCDGMKFGFLSDFVTGIKINLKELSAIQLAFFSLRIAQFYFIVTLMLICLERVGAVHWYSGKCAAHCATLCTDVSLKKSYPQKKLSKSILQKISKYLTKFQRAVEQQPILHNYSDQFVPSQGFIAVFSEWNVWNQLWWFIQPGGMSGFCRLCK